MKDETIFSKQERFVVLQIAFAFLVLLCLIFFICQVAAIEVPPEVEKKAVLLNMTNADAERSFAAICGKCHKTPDPAQVETIRQSCSGNFSKDALVQMQKYMANVRTGKEIYGTYCDRCHSLIDPGAHTFDYWSKNICTSDSCMVKRKLNSDEEQQLLLYLSSHARKK